MAFPVTRSDSGAKLTTGATIATELSLGGTAVAHSEQLKNGTAALHVTVPATAKGKVLTVRVAIAFAGQTVTKLTTFHVG